MFFHRVAYTDYGITLVLETVNMSLLTLRYLLPYTILYNGADKDYRPGYFTNDSELGGMLTDNSHCEIKNNTEQGAVSIRKTVLPGMAIPMLKIRRPNGRLIFNMEIAIRR